MGLKKSTRFTGAIGAGTIGLVVVCVAAAAMLIAARGPSQPADMTRVEVQPQQAAAMEPTAKKKVSTARVPAKKTAASKAPAAGAVPATTLTADATAARPPAPKAESASKVLVEEPSAVTITGCLERDDEKFRLKDTTGVDAPKSRNWKSGFLKNGSASIEIVDAANRLKLPNHVGQRVSVTGMLVDREMDGRSLQRVAKPCD